jgi:hypothetical protein
MHNNCACLQQSTAAPEATGLGLGAVHTCVIRKGDGSLTCFGSNTSNKLGTIARQGVRAL